jgi:hypothetical protein
MNSFVQANTFPLLIIPYLASQTGVSNTIVAIPNRESPTLAGPCVLIPDHTSLTLLHEHTKIPIPLRTFSTGTSTFTLRPYLPIQTKHTDRTVPVEMLRAFTSPELFIEFFTVGAGGLHHTRKTIPELPISTNAGLECFIPDLVTFACYSALAVVTVPAVPTWTQALLRGGVPLL